MKTKTTILAFFAALFTLAVTAQDKKPNQPDPAIKVTEAQSNVLVLSKDSVLKITDLKAVKVLQVGDRSFSVEALASNKAEVVFLTPEWIIEITELLESVPTGKSKKFVQLLQAPLLPYYQAYLKAAQEQAELQKQKEVPKQ